MNFSEIEKRTIVQIIEKNCKEITNLYLNFDFFLYHGKTTNENFMIVNNKEYRNPKDTKKDIHDLVDKAMKSLNFKARRSNSLFCTSNEIEAKKYGNSVYVVFPYDGFSYSYSPYIPDFTQFSEELISSIYDEFNEENYYWYFEVKNSKKYGFNIDNYYTVKYFLRNYFMDEAHEILKNFYNSNKKFYNLKELLNSYPDFFDFHGFDDEKLAIKIKNLVEEYGTTEYFKDIENTKEFSHLLELKIESLYTDDNLLEAVEKEVEIMINAQKFLLVNLKVLNSIEDLKNLLKNFS